MFAPAIPMNAQQTAAQVLADEAALKQLDRLGLVSYEDYVRAAHKLSHRKEQLVSFIAADGAEGRSVQVPPPPEVVRTNNCCEQRANGKT